MSISMNGTFGPLYRAVDTALMKVRGFVPFSAIMADKGVRHQMYAVGAAPTVVSNYLQQVSRKKIRRLPRSAMPEDLVKRYPYKSKYFYTWNADVAAPTKQARPATLVEATTIRTAPVEGNGQQERRVTARPVPLDVLVNTAEQTLKVRLGSTEVCLRVVQ